MREMPPEHPDDALVREVGLLFFDCQTVKAVPSDYARCAIKLVRDFDALKNSTKEEDQ
jgi:hypothetical protein